MSQYTASIIKGDLAAHHNRRQDRNGNDLTRETAPKNIDTDRSGQNVSIVDRRLPQLYREVFGEALAEHNAKQVAKGHPERQIADYYEHAKASKTIKVAHEFVVQVGNKDERPDAETAVEIYREWLSDFQGRYGSSFAVAQAIVHMDETTPHMHVELVPTAQSSRGLGLQNSLNKAVEQAGYERTQEQPRPYNAMLADWDGMLTERMRQHGIERVAGDKERQFGGISIKAVREASAYQAAREREADKIVAVAEREAEQVRVGLEGSRAELAQARQEAEAAKAEVADTRHELAQAKAETREAAAERDTARAEAAQAEQARADAKQETAEELSRSECLRQGNDAKAAEVERLGERCQEAEQRVAELERQAGRARQGAEELKGQVEQARSEEQGSSLGEQVRSLGREAAEAVQRAGREEGPADRSLGELEAARSAAEERIRGLERENSELGGRVQELEAERAGCEARLEGVQEERREMEASHEQEKEEARGRLEDLRERIGDLRERVVERLSELKERFGLAYARSVFNQIRESTGLSRTELGDRTANRVNAVMEAVPRQQQQPAAEREWSARDYERYYEQDRGLER